MRARSATRRSAAGRTSESALLASAGVNMRSGTAPEHRMDSEFRTVPRLAGWLALVGLMIALSYTSRATEGKPDPEVLYRWSTAVGGVIQDGIILLVVLALAGFDRDMLALRRPRSIKQAVGIVLAAVVAIYAFEIVYSALTHPGNEQGLTPTRWEPDHAA